MVSTLVQTAVDAFTAVLGGIGGAIPTFFQSLIYWDHDADPLTPEVTTAFAEYAFLMIGLGLAVSIGFALFAMLKGRKAKRA